MKEAVQTMNGNIRILKGDIQMVRGDLQKLEERTDTKMDAKFEKFAATITQHMNVVAENLVHDFNGIFKDRLEQHEDRIVRLEKHVGLVRV